MDPTELLKWFVAAVKAEATLSDLEERVFPDAAPEGTKNPCLVYQLVGNEGDPTVDGGPANEGSLAYQIRIYGDSRKSANSLREAFRQKFEGLCPMSIGGGQRIEGSGWGDLGDTFDTATKDYGALGIVEIHISSK